MAQPDPNPSTNAARLLTIYSALRIRAVFILCISTINTILDMEEIPCTIILNM